MVIKVQVRWFSELGVEENVARTDPMMVCDQSRNFVCIIHCEDNPGAFDIIAKTVRTKGVGGAKA
jgi:hypothetical protein